MCWSVGDSPSGKASAFGADIRGFESLIPSQVRFEQKLNKHSHDVNAYLLLSVSLILFILYYSFYGTVNLNNAIETESISLSILLIVLPLLFISIIPSYVFAKMINVKKSPFIVVAGLFSLFYIFISFVSLVIFSVIGGLQ